MTKNVGSDPADFHPESVARALDAVLEAGGVVGGEPGASTSLRQHLPPAGSNGVLVGIFLRHFG
ncbi:MAG: hypothetical protein AB8H80_23715 [Planctomycetota bacterium]